MDPSDYIYENEREEYKLYPVIRGQEKKSSDEIPKHEVQQIRKIMRYLLDKQKHPEKYMFKKSEIYDLWNNNIFETGNNPTTELLLPFALPGHKDSYNPPAEFKYDEERKKKILRKKPDAMIPSVYGDITKLKCSPKILYDVYQRCLNLLYSPRSIKPVMDLKKEDLLPQLPPIHSLKPFPEYPFVEYIMNAEKEKEREMGITMKGARSIDINERENLVFAIQSNKLHLFDIMTSYNIATISLESYFDQVKQNDNEEYEQTDEKSQIKQNTMNYFNNVIIKVNKGYSVAAISFGDCVLLIHYQHYEPPPRCRNTGIEEIYHSSKKRKGNGTDKNKTEARGEGSENDSEENSDAEFDDCEDVDDDEQETEEETENEKEMEDDEAKEKTKEKKKNKSKSKKMPSSYNNYQVFSRTRELIKLWKEKFSKSKTYCYSDKLDIEWIELNSTDAKIKYCAVIKHPGQIRDITWSENGIYLSVICMRKMGAYHDAFLHHLKSMKSIKLIKKYKQKRGDIIQTRFFTKNPYFAVAFKKSVIIYNLKAHSSKRKIFKTLTGVTGITSFDIHKNEEYVVVSNDMGTAFIFDLELSSTPYKKFHLQNAALSKVLFSKSHHLFCSLSEHGVVNLFYSKFFDDYITDPILIPIIQLRNKNKIADLVWSGKMPWLFAQTEQNTALLYT